MRAVVAWLTALLLGACAGRDTDIGSEAARDFASGSRLRARLYVMDGAEVLAGFHDNVEDVDCTFTSDGFVGNFGLGPAGHRTCLPTKLARHSVGVGPFADAACTKLAGNAGEEEDWVYGASDATDSCVAGPSVFRITSVMRGSYTLATGKCEFQRVGNAAVFGERVPDDTFVQAVETVEPRAGRIAARVLRTADGARQTLGGWDVERNEAVEAHAFTREGVKRWFPARVAFGFPFEGGGDFADAACTRPAATKVTHNADCPLSAVAALYADGCTAFYGLGPRIEATYQKNEQGVCGRTMPSGALAHVMGDAIANTAFEPVVMRDSGYGPIRLRGPASKAGDIVMLDTIVDSRTGFACVPNMIAGALRCGPATKDSMLVFADDSCTQPAIAHYAVGCSEREPPSWVRSSDDARVFVVTHPIAAGYMIGPRGCVARAAENESYFAVREADVATLAKVSERVE